MNSVLLIYAQKQNYSTLNYFLILASIQTNSASLLSNLKPNYKAIMQKSNYQYPFMAKVYHIQNYDQIHLTTKLLMRVKAETHRVSIF